ncbi:MAG TPA: hypothetical protein VHW71_04670 [Steroidobacteraceae bacterium]|jgi:hypothetical protein|nr:hypothetical protein [Steroidobacteraceae bacterium]
MKILPLLLSLALAGGVSFCAVAAPAGTLQIAHPAAWEVRTSMGFDALCALNILSGDPYYTVLYPDETAMFQDAKYADARAAAVELKRRIKDEGKSIISAALVLVFSGGPDDTLDDLLHSARAPQQLERAFRAAAQWDQDTWREFLDSRETVVRALEAMRRAGFEQWWREHVAPETSAKAAELRSELAKYDMSAEQRRLMGPSFKSDRLTVILLHFSKPHGIRIQGSRYLLNVGYPLRIVLRGGAHEPFHPPFDIKNAGVKAAIARIGSGATLQNIVKTHDPSFGYNSAEGMIDEDSTQALEQIVSERLGFSSPARERWEADDGMHLLAAAIYDAMRETGFVATGGVYQEWFVAMAKRGEFDEQALRARATRVLGAQAVARWTPHR